MRLIDADAFEKFIKEKYKDGESTDDIKDQMLFDLSYQPTAYDVEKVVAKIKRSSGNGYRDIDGDYVPPMIETKDVIEIIRKGGVNET